MLLLSSADFFSTSTFSKNSSMNTIWVSNWLDPDQAQHFIKPDLDPICLQRLWADDTSQGRRQVFKSGPAEEAIECRRPPLVRGGLGASPEKIFEFWALPCAFLMGVLCVWDQILVVLVTQIFLVAWETECWTKLLSDSHMLFFFTFFFIQHVSLTLFHLCPRKF